MARNRNAGAAAARTIAVAVTAAAAVLSPAAGRADEVVFKNGDRLTGKVETMEGGKLKIKSAVAGDVTVDMKNVKTFATDAPVEVRLTDGTVLRQRVAAAGDGQVAVAQPAAGGGNGAAAAPAAGQGAARNVPLSQVKKINPNERWNGALTVGGLLTRGNSDTEQLNVSIDLTRRREADRVTVGAGYLFGRQRDASTGDKATTTDNWFAMGKYDYFFTPKFYGYGSVRVERDRIAELDLRLTPSVGAGYQWVETPQFNFQTEAGMAYVVESYSNDGNDDHVAARVAYHVDRRVNDRVSLFHNLAYLPSLEALNDYNLIADAGVRASLTDKMFTEFKLQWNYDATPAPGASRSDLRYILGVGWKF